MITLAIIWLILSAIGAVKFWVYEKNLEEMGIWFALPFAISIVVVPILSVFAIIFLCVKYLP